LPQDVSADQQPLLAEAGSAAFQFMSGDEKGATQAFQKLFQDFPTASNAHFFFGHLLFATDPDAAIPQFQRELEVDPSNVNAEVMLAWGLLLRSRAAEALPYAQKVVSQQPGLSSAQLVLGRALMETGDLAGAIQHLERALALDTNDLEVHLALAKAYSLLGRSDDARRERMLCLQLTQDNSTRLANP
jgi:Flp pilus assembly protein TadD